jgi:hypothetical protein
MKRRRWIVTPEFQVPIVIKTLIVAVVVVTFFTWSTFYFLWKSLLNTGHGYMIPLLYKPSIWIGLGICLIASLVFSAMLMVKVTHRVAGQMYRFENEIDHLISGQTPRPLKTREDDYFHDFEAVLNGCILKGDAR